MIMGRSKVILPKKLSVDPARMARAITNTLNATALAIQTDFKVTTQTWSNKPTFHIDSPTPYTRTVSTHDDVYTMLNEGTRPHTVAPHGKVLVFNAPFRSKTVPRSISSKPGRTGSATVFTRNEVHHPGTEAREWDTTIAKKWDKQVGDIFQRAIDAEIN
jgi:hypothetical protein